MLITITIAKKTILICFQEAIESKYFEFPVDYQPNIQMNK